MNSRYTDTINLNAKVIDIDSDKRRITLLYDDSSYVIEINEAFEDSFNQIELLYKSDDKVIESDDTIISLVNVIIEKDKIRFNKELNSYIILEPNWLINVTALTEFDFCERSLFNNRFSIRSQNEYMLIGNIVHEVFEDIMIGMNTSKENLFKTLHNKLDYSIRSKVFDFALLGLDIDQIIPIIKKHLNSLYLYIRENKDYHQDKEILTEHYIIDTSLGLKGKIDSIIVSAENMLALELKTGKSWGGKVKPGHAFQAQAYSLLLENKYKSKIINNPIIIYSGDSQYYNKEITPIPELGIETDFDYASKAHVINLRNRLVTADFFFKLEYEKNNLKKCEKCFQALMCSTINHLEPIEDSQNQPIYDVSETPFTATEESFFKNYNKYLTEECALIKNQIGNYFLKETSNRVEIGKCIEINSFKIVENKNIQVLCDNRSELREQDRCLISDDKGPVKGECLEAVVISITENSIILKIRRELRFNPKWIDSVSSEVMFERNYPSLIKLLELDNLLFLKKILINNQPPLNNQLKEFENTDIGIQLNEAQNKVVQSALGLNNLLLIQGPPGTGKTITIAKIVQKMYNEGKTILLSCFTHRAIDELIRKIALHASDVPLYRIGSFSLDENINHYNMEDSNTKESNIKEEIKGISEIIDKSPVYIGTSQAWLSGKYDNLIKKELYDVAIIDEASQMTLPNSIGVIRHSKKFILVGDHFQQPPIIQSKNAKELSRTLFQILFENDILPESTKIMLDTQHRMNPVIGDFISGVFYNNKLKHSHAIDQKKIYNSSDSHLTIGKICDPNDIITLVHSENPHQSVKNKSVEEDAEIILDIIEFLIKKDVDPKSIGVIAPYRAQVALIRRKVENFISGSEIQFSTKNMIDTIDRFQGDERDVIIFSICLSHDIQSDLLKDIRKINVALSRAKKKLIVVGNWDLADDYKIFKSLFNYVKKNKHSKLIRI